MNDDGIALSMEAMIGLLLVAGAVMAVPRIPSTDYRTVQAIQLEHDLLIVWGNTRPNLNEMLEDARMVFPNQAIRIQKNGEIAQTRDGNDWISSDGSYFDDWLQEQRVRITLLH